MTTNEQITFMEEDISYLRGRLDAISSLCALLIATHPRGTKIVEVLKARASEVAGLEQPTVFVEAYADGFSRFGFDLNVEEILESFHRDELKLFRTPQSGGH